MRSTLAMFAVLLCSAYSLAQLTDWNASNQAGEAALAAGQYKRAEEAFKESAKIAKAANDDIRFATSWCNLGRTLVAEEKYEDATRHLRQCCRILERQPDAAPLRLAEAYEAMARIPPPNASAIIQSPNSSVTLDGLMIGMDRQSARAAAAELEKALVIYQRVLAPGSLELATKLATLAEVYYASNPFVSLNGVTGAFSAIGSQSYAQGRSGLRGARNYEQVSNPRARSDPFLTSGAFSPGERRLGAECSSRYPADRGSLRAAELYGQALGIRQKALGNSVPDVIDTTRRLALAYFAAGNYEQVAPLASALRKLPPDAANVSLFWCVARMEYSRKDNAEAAAYYSATLPFVEQTFGREWLPKALREYSDVLKKLNRMDEAEAMKRRADEVSSKKQK